MLLFFALFALWRRRRTEIAILVAALAWAIGAGWFATPLLDLAQHGYRHTDVPSFAPQTTIVLMGGGTQPTDSGLVPKYGAMRRIDAAGMLYRECRETSASCKVVLSGGDPEHHGQAEADNYAPYVLAQGVASGDLVRENQSLNTYQNARNVAGILGPAHDSRLIVVTSAYHMRRAMLAFEAFGYAPVPYVSDVRPNRATLVPRIRGFMNSELAMHELVGLARFRVYRWLNLY
ncbi:YdcF family protein [Caballeronia temeraria]|uniref:YdcF family protein n=1 Tax=Caballeronia temeraria TaxID=1777137 RepID=UPI000772324A|nr:YdcF family protein [Caballeronia temeraria]